MFADDVQLRFSGPVVSGPDVIASVNIELDRIKKWSEDNGLRLNPLKTQAIYISKTRVDTSLWPDIMLGGVTIIPSEKIKNLGVVFNRTLTWSDQVSSICGKVYGGLRRLWKLSNIIPFNIRLRLVKTLLIPYFTYGDIVLTSLSSVLRRKLNVAYNSCVRFIYKLRRYDHISIHADSIFGCSLEKYYDFRVCIALYKLIVTKQPNYLFRKLSFSNSLRTLKLNVTRRRTSSMDYAFFIRGIKLWNSLPILIKRTRNLNHFKKLCLYHFCNI